MTPHLSVVVPFHDEAASLLELHGEIAHVLDALDCAAEIVFVDDGSRDAGPEIVAAVARLDPRVRMLTLASRSGQSAALQAGFDAARGEIVATLDADLQNEPRDLPRLLDGLGHADCVCGYRVDRCDPLAKRLASRVANRVRRWALDDGVRDVGCSLRVMRMSYLRRVRLFHGGHRFLPALLAMQGARVAELPVRHRARRHGRSNYDIRRRLGAVWLDLLGVLWLQRRAARSEVKELSRRV